MKDLIGTSKKSNGCFYDIFLVIWKMISLLHQCPEDCEHEKALVNHQWHIEIVIKIARF